METGEVATLLTEIGQRLALAGESPYKARAYARAAENPLTLTMPLREVIGQGRLREIPGVGAAIAATIEELTRRGTTSTLERLRADAPASVLEMLRIPGLAPEKVAKIHTRLGIGSLHELEQACREDRVARTKGLGASVQAKALQGLELMRRGHGQRLIHQAAPTTEWRSRSMPIRIASTSIGAGTAARSSSDACSASIPTRTRSRSST